MAVDILNTTTLSSAIDNEAFNFAVASTTNITAGQLLVVNGEVMKVNAVDDPSSGYVKVVRGVAGTEPRAHAASKRVFIGDPDDFKAVKAGASYLGLTGATGTLPEYLLPGVRAVDADGNVYVMVELTQTVYTGVTVVISVDGNYTAAVLASGTHGSVGVMAEPASSDQYAWAQIYGYVAAAQEAGGTSAATSAYFPVAATSVSSPAAGLAVLDTSSAVNGFTINGMFITGAASSATTSATSSTGVTVPLWLNYPYVEAAAAGSS
jgi:hypothetical protein